MFDVNHRNGSVKDVSNINNVPARAAGTNTKVFKLEVMYSLFICGGI